MQTDTMRRAAVATAILGLLASSPVAGQPQDAFFDAAGVRIRYVEQGAGEPVVLLHGIGGSLQSWIDTGFFAALAKDHRVIAFDARGHGKSGKPHDPQQYGRQMALDVVRLLDHLSIRQAHVIGYSMGAGTTSMLLTLHPERVLTATLAAGAGRFDWNDEAARMAEQEATERERDCVSRTMSVRLAAPNTPLISEAEFKQRSDACMADPNQDRFALAAVTRARRDTLVPPEKAAAVKVPTLGIAGTLDPALAAVQQLKKIRPALQVVTVEGAVHASAAPNGLMRKPEFVAAVRAFIASRGQRTTRD